MIIILKEVLLCKYKINIKNKIYFFLFIIIITIYFNIVFILIYYIDPI